MSVTITLKGKANLLARLKTIKAQTRQAVEAEVLAGALEIETDAKLLAPVDTGRLRASIKAEILSRRSNYKIQVGTNISYAPFVEFGTVRQRAQPFLYPAYAKNAQRIQDRVKAILRGIR